MAEQYHGWHFLSQLDVKHRSWSEWKWATASRVRHVDPWGEATITLSWTHNLACTAKYMQRRAKKNYLILNFLTLKLRQLTVLGRREICGRRDWQGHNCGYNEAGIRPAERENVTHGSWGAGMSAQRYLGNTFFRETKENYLFWTMQLQAFPTVTV